MKKLLSGAILTALIASCLLLIGCDSKTTTKTTETKESPNKATTEVKEKP